MSGPTSPAQVAGGPMRHAARQLWYLPVLGIAMALMMLRVLLMARLLDVPGFAAYSAGLLVATTFCMLSCLGLYALLQRDMPLMLARGQRRRAMLQLLQCLLVAAACALVLLPLTGLPADLAGASGVLLAIGLLNGLAQQAFLVATVESRSVGDPVRYAWQNFVRAVLIIGMSSFVAVTTRSAAWTLATELLITMLISAAIVLRAERGVGLAPVLLWRLAMRRWQRLPWRTALVFLAISLVASSLFSVDRWLSASLLAAADFAQYAFAGTIVLIAQTVQSMVNASLYPLLARRYALAGPLVAYRLAARVSLGLLAAAALACVPVYFLAAGLITRLYPAYEPSVALLPVLLAVGIARIADYWSGYLAIAGHERRLLVLSLAVGVVGAAAWAAAMAAGGWHPRPLEFAWLALLLSAGLHATAAIAATLASRSMAGTGAKP